MNDSVNELKYSHEGDGDLLDELAAAVFRIGRLMAQRHGAPGEEGRLSGPQFMMLRTIEAEGPLRVSDIANLLGVKNPAASMLLRAMTTGGLVERTFDPEDRRAVLVTLSDEGRARLAEADGIQRHYMHRYTQDLSTQDLEALVRALCTLIETIERENDDDD